MKRFAISLISFSKFRHSQRQTLIFRCPQFRNEQVATVSFLIIHASQLYDFSATVLCRGISGASGTPGSGNKMAGADATRDEILAEKLVPGREGYGYQAPGKFREIFLALRLILDGSKISRGPTPWTFQDIFRFLPETCILSCTLRTALHSSWHLVLHRAECIQHR